MPAKHGFCGFLVKENVMRKLQKITAKFEGEVKHILTDNIDDIEAYGWSLAHPNGKQTVVQFAEPASLGEKTHTIKLFKPMQPQYLSEVYRCGAFSEDAKNNNHRNSGGSK